MNFQMSSSAFEGIGTGSLAKKFQPNIIEGKKYKNSFSRAYFDLPRLCDFFSGTSGLNFWKRLPALKDIPV
jgi:hypothetical protein